MGERRYVTVLFADIVESSRLVAGRDPEDAQEVLNRHLQGMTEIIHFYGGTVCQVLGDGLLVVFGAPIAQSDHAERACAAALHLTGKAPTQNVASAARTSALPQVRIGMHCGEVVLEAVRNDVNIDYRPIGETVYIASRLQQHAAPGQTLLSHSVHRSVSTMMTVSQIEDWQPRGFTRAFTIYQLERARPSTAHTVAAPSRFIGRQTELRQLAGAYEKVARDNPQMVLVHGSAGMGKSRLIEEFLTRIKPAPSPPEVIRIRQSPICSLQPHHGLRSLVQTILDVDGGDSPGFRNEQVLEFVRAHHIDGHHATAVLCELLDLPHSDASWERLDHVSRQDHIAATIAAILSARSLDHTMVVVFEDLHNSDEDTIAIIKGFIDRIAVGRLFFLCSSRTHVWTDEECPIAVDRLRLERLSPTETREFISDRLGEVSEESAQYRSILRRSGGVPFFLAELVHDAGSNPHHGDPIDNPAGHAGFGDYGELPDAVKNIILSRVDRLPEELRQLLLYASVAGETFSFGLLHAVSRTSERKLRRHIRDLELQGYIAVDSLFPDIRLRFTHALFQETAYSLLLRSRRRVLHRTALAFLESRRASLDGNYARAELFHHAMHAGLAAKAVTYGLAAARHAMSVSAIDTAIGYFEAAIKIATDSDHDHDEAEILFAELELAVLYFLRNRQQQQERLIAHVIKRADELEHWELRGRALAAKALHAWSIGDLKDALACAEAAFDHAVDGDDDAHFIHTGSRLAAMCQDTGDLRRAWNLWTEILDRLEKHDADQSRFGLAAVTAAAGRAKLAWCAAELGRFEFGAEIGQEGLAIALGGSDRFSQIYCLHALGLVHIYQKDFVTASSLFERGIALTESVHNHVWLCALKMGSAYAYLGIGEARKSVSEFESAFILAESSGLRTYMSRYLAWYAEALNQVGLKKKAMRTAASAVAMARETGERANEALALCVQAELGLRTGAPSAPQAARDSIQTFDAAFQLAKRYELSPLLARIELGKGHALVSLGQDEQGLIMIRDAESELLRLGIAA
ncbi:MAG: adenylate/guanylate cyclase domain-containing protein [Alphaproteobacteria bacterium]